jgi:hypothetical protein
MTEMPDRLAEWTREVERYITNGRGPVNEFEARSVQALARLTDALAQLEGERDKALQRIRELEAQVARLREALERVVRLYEDEVSAEDWQRPMWLRAALAATEGKPS